MPQSRERKAQYQREARAKKQQEKADMAEQGLQGTSRIDMKSPQYGSPFPRKTSKEEQRELRQQPVNPPGRDLEIEALRERLSWTEAKLEVVDDRVTALEEKVAFEKQEAERTLWEHPTQQPCENIPPVHPIYRQRPRHHTIEERDVRAGYTGIYTEFEEL